MSKSGPGLIVKWKKVREISRRVVNYYERWESCAVAMKSDKKREQEDGCDEGWKICEIVYAVVSLVLLNRSD